MLCDVNSTNMQSNQRISPNFKIKYLYNKDRENYAVNCAFISKTVKMVHKCLENLVPKIVKRWRSNRSDLSVALKMCFEV